MQKIIFMIRDLGIGGIESSFINLVKELKKLGYDITIVFKKNSMISQEFLKDIKTINLNIEEFDKNIFNKIKKKLKILYYIIKLYNKYDFSGCYTDYCCELSKLARAASKNNAIWMHSNYITLFNNDKKTIKKFFSRIKIEKFKNIVCVSNDSKKSINKIFPNNNFSIKVIKNLFNLSYNNKEIPTDYKKQKFTFLNVSRHDEGCKKISRIINAAELLKKDNIDFNVLFVGEGKDTNKYIKISNKTNCKDNLIFLGSKTNSLPYYNVADALLISSDSEGGPVVLLEALYANIPIITTNVGYVSDFINKENGIIVEKNEKALYKAMKSLIKNIDKYKYTFDYRAYNQREIKKLTNLFRSR